MTMEEIFRTKPSKDRVSVEAERQLIEQAQSTAHYAAAAQWDLVRQYRGLLQATSYKIRARAPGMPPEQIEDLESDLVLVTLDAIRDFNLETHIRLSHTLVTLLNREAANRTEALKIPSNTLARWAKILRQADGDHQRAALAAPKMDMSTDTFRAIHHALDHVEGEWSELPYRADARPAPDEQTHALAHQALGMLTDERREVVELAYGFRGDPKPDSEVSEILGITRKAAELRRTRSIAQLRTALGEADS